MAIAKLALINIVGDMKCLDDVILQCMGREDFHPERAMDYANVEAGFSMPSGDNPYAGLLSKLESLGQEVGFDMAQAAPVKPISAGVADSRKQFFVDFYQSFSENYTYLVEQKDYLQDEIQQDESTLGHLRHINDLDVDLDMVLNCTYLKARIGRLPDDGFAKLGYYRDKLFLFVPLEVQKGYHWGMYFAMRDDMAEVDEIFSSLFFERTRMPDFVHGRPDEALETIKAGIDANRAKLSVVQKQIDKLLETERKRFLEIYGGLKYLSGSFEMRTCVATLKRNFLHIFHITGFIEEKNADEFASTLRILDGVTVEILPHDSDKRIKVPTKLHNGWFSQPFEMFVEMYGLPSYGDIDPTTIIAVTYSLLFGIMFGDLGQGLVLVLLGALLWHFKKMNIGRIMNRIGISSSIFGVIYGSVFGFEELLTPFYVNVLGLPGKPIELMAPEMTNFILGGAVGLGVVLICFSILLDILIAVRRRDVQRALFSANGVAGLVFYSSVLYGAIMLLLFKENLFSSLYVITLIVLPLMIILFKEPLGRLCEGVKPSMDGMGSYLTENVFELFEVVLSFFSNTMSFLRVGGFVLSHAGMMAVVFTLSSMVGEAASPIVIIIGNIFVMCMEGLIVGIQVLRLEFYEMFSRYFDGDGRPFVAAATFRKEN